MKWKHPQHPNPQYFYITARVLFSFCIFSLFFFFLCYIYLSSLPFQVILPSLILLLSLGILWLDLDVDDDDGDFPFAISSHFSILD